MTQLQSMIQSVVRSEMKPIYAELEQVKAVVDEDMAVKAETVCDAESEEEYDDDVALALLRAAPASAAATGSAGDTSASAGMERKTARSNPY